MTVVPFGLDDACLQALENANNAASQDEIREWKSQADLNLAICEHCKENDKTCEILEDKIPCVSCSNSRRRCSFRTAFMVWRLRPWTQEQYDQLVAYKQEKQEKGRATRKSLAGQPPASQPEGDENSSPAPRRSAREVTYSRKRKGSLNSPSKPPAKQPRLTHIQSTPTPSLTPVSEFAPVTVYIDETPHTAYTQSQLDDLVNQALEQHANELRNDLEVLKERLSRTEAEKSKIKDMLQDDHAELKSKIVELDASLNQATQALAAERARTAHFQTLAAAGAECARRCEVELAAEKQRASELIAAAEARVQAAEIRVGSSPKEQQRVEDFISCIQSLRRHLDISALPALFDTMTDIYSAKNDASHIEKGIQRWIPSLWTLVLMQPSLPPEAKAVVVNSLTELSSKAIL